MNAGKEELVLAMLRRWRRAAVRTATIQWRCFFEQGRFDPFFDPATAYRKAGAISEAKTSVRSCVLNALDQIIGQDRLL